MAKEIIIENGQEVLKETTEAVEVVKKTKIELQTELLTYQAHLAAINTELATVMVKITELEADIALFSN